MCDEIILNLEFYIQSVNQFWGGIKIFSDI